LVCQRRLRLLDTPYGLFAVLLLSFATATADDVVTFLAKDGKQTLKRKGTIDDYTGEGVVLTSAQGRQETIPLDRLLSIQTAATDEETQGDALRRKGDLAGAIEAYKKARTGESRKWGQRRIAAKLVDAYDAAGKIDSAVEEFLPLIAADDQSPHFAMIPLAWRSASDEGVVATKAERWMSDSKQPAAVLIGASWLLVGPQRQKAITALKSISTDLDPRIAHLASAQLWRTLLVTAQEADVARWQAQIARIPAELRAGPQLVLGDALLRLGRTDEALLAYLEGPLCGSPRESLAGTALLAAARAMEKEKRSDEAQRLLEKIRDDYPAFARTHDVAASGGK
jgi:tetratricopeptide (TPR) repeat protein